MAGSDPPVPEPPPWFKAVEPSVDPLLTASALLALVAGAEAGGLPQVLRHPTTTDAAAGLPDERVPLTETLRMNDVTTGALRDLSEIVGIGHLSPDDQLTCASATRTPATESALGTG
jgi:hypothetical protein